MTPPPAAFRPPPVACLLALALLLAAGGCGEQSSGEAGSGPAASSGTTGRSASAPPPAGPASACPRQLGAFVDSLAALRSRLAAGLSYEQYRAQVQSLRASYREIPVGRLSLDCLGAGTAGERALNEHVDAVNSWGECLADAACTTEAIEPVLQRRWRVASRYLSEAT